jgi:hypothetical protein
VRIFPIFFKGLVSARHGGIGLQSQPCLSRLRQEDLALEARLSYVVRHCFKKQCLSWVLVVAHIYNLSYSEGGDQEKKKPAWANSSQDPILKKTHHKKRACGVAQSVGPEFKPQHCNKKKKKKTKEQPGYNSNVHQKVRTEGVAPSRGSLNAC